MEHNDMGDRLEGAMKVLPHPFHIAAKSPADFDHNAGLALSSTQHSKPDIGASYLARFRNDHVMD